MIILIITNVGLGLQLREGGREKERGLHTDFMAKFSSE